MNVLLGAKILDSFISYLLKIQMTIKIRMSIIFFLLRRHQSIIFFMQLQKRLQIHTFLHSLPFYFINLHTQVPLELYTCCIEQLIIYLMSNRSNDDDLSDGAVQTPVSHNRKINYRYNFDQLKIDQKAKIHRRDKCFDEQDSYDVIYSELSFMFEDHYDFRYSHNQYSHQSRKGEIRGQFSRKTKLRYRCQSQKCPYFKKYNNFNAWTSYYGLVEYKFAIRSLNTKYLQNLGYGLKYPFIVTFAFTIFKQKCKECGQWGGGKIYVSQLETITRMVCFIIAQRLDQPRKNESDSQDDQKQSDSPPPPKGPEDEQKAHQKENCEACSLGKCKKLKKIRRNKKRKQKKS